MAGQSDVDDAKIKKMRARIYKYLRHSIFFSPLPFRSSFVPRWTKSVIPLVAGVGMTPSALWTKFRLVPLVPYGLAKGKIRPLCPRSHPWT